MDLTDIFYVGDFIKILEGIKQKYGNDVKMAFEVDISNLQYSDKVEKVNFTHIKEHNLIIVKIIYT